MTFQNQSAIPLNMTNAQKVADSINKVLVNGDVQICNYACRYIIRRGSVMVADHNSIRVNGKGDAFLIGSFTAYSY